MKRKILSTLLAITLLFSLASVNVFANQTVTVYLDNQPLQFDVPPQIINGRTMVPMRKIFESLGATVEWDGITQTVTSVKGSTAVSLTIGVPSITINGTVKTLDTAPWIDNGRTLVPVRAVSEAFNCNVEWDGNNNSVNIKSQNEPVVIYDKNGIRITYKSQKYDTYNNYVIYFLLENNSDQTVTIFPSPNCSVNGYMVDAQSYDTLTPGKKVNTDVDFAGYLLEKNGITEVKEFELRFTLKINGEYNATDFIKFNTSGPILSSTSTQETNKDSFSKVKEYIIKNGVKNDKSANNIVYICEFNSSSGKLKAMYREKTNDLRFVYEVYGTTYEKDSGLTPNIILTMKPNSAQAEISAIIYYDMGVDHWSPAKEYKKSELTKSTIISLDSKTGYGIVSIPSKHKASVDNFTTQSTKLLFESIKSFISNSSVSLSDLGFTNY